MAMPHSRVAIRRKIVAKRLGMGTQPQQIAEETLPQKDNASGFIARLSSNLPRSSASDWKKFSSRDRSDGGSWHESDSDAAIINIIKVTFRRSCVISIPGVTFMLKRCWPGKLPVQCQAANLSRINTTCS